MTPEAFIARWKDNTLTERAGAQAHFDDLCDLLGVDKPRDSVSLFGYTNQIVINAMVGVSGFDAEPSALKVRGVS